MGLCLPRVPHLLKSRGLWEAIRPSPVVPAAGLAQRGELHHAQQRTIELGLSQAAWHASQDRTVGRLLPPSACAPVSVMGSNCVQLLAEPPGLGTDQQQMNHSMCWARAERFSPR